MKHSRFLLWFWLSFLMLGVPTSMAETQGCPDASSALMDSLCIDCFYPVEIAGAVTGGSAKDLPVPRAPSTCICPGRFGYPTEGYTVGMWKPSYLLETTRLAGCSTVLGGTFMLGKKTAIKKAGGPGESSTFYHVNLYGYPLDMVADMIPSSMCSKPQQNTAFELTYMSALDSTFSDDELANQMAPDAALITGYPAMIACMADAVASTVSQPLEALYFCAGSWGQMFPLTGFTAQKSVPVRESSLAGTRALNLEHRNGELNLTYGLAVCFDIPWPILPKQQYRFSQAYPMAETKKSRWIGSNVTVTGLERRTQVTTGEDFVQTVWRFEQCCANF